ncbi:deoxyuridine 5'-triphosphate nucleotidohydrolase-like [Phascolarctos cinereus]
MNGLLKEKLKKLSENHDLKRWKENLFEALKQLNNRPLTDGGGTPLSRMMTPNLQIRRISSPLTIQWWTLHENARQPWHASLGSAGYDLYVIHDVHIPPLGQQLCSTGVGVKLPEGHYGQLFSRSGLALNNQVHVLGGVIDNDYRGEIKVCLHNSHESEPFECKTGERICQLVILPYLNGSWQKINGSPTPQKRRSGFGSSNNSDISWIPERQFLVLKFG